MQGNTLPPLTPLPASARQLIRFSPGLGVLEESAAKGLRCPVCGQYHHALATHIRLAHKNIGGVRAVRSALDIPDSVPLMSAKAKAAHAERSFAGIKASTRVNKAQRNSSNARDVSAARRSMHHRNLQDRCEAQLRHKMLDLRNRLGRAPSKSDAAAVYGGGFPQYVARAYGSWTAAVARFLPDEDIGWGALVRERDRKERERFSALEQLRCWYKAHGDLPTAREARAGTILPLISYDGIRKGLGNATWDECMRIAASLLNIYGGRYGLTEKSA